MTHDQQVLQVMGVALRNRDSELLDAVQERTDLWVTTPALRAARQYLIDQSATASTARSREPSP